MRRSATDTTRRGLGVAFALLSLALGACRSQPEAAPEARASGRATAPAARAPEVARAPATQGAAAESPPGFEYSETLSAGARATEALPLILALHGLGDAPSRFLQLFEGFPCPARIVAPHSGDPYGSGYSWFEFRRGDPNFAAPTIAARADALALFVSRLSRERPTRGRPLVTGFSQGGALSFAIAAEHGSEVAGVFPVGGWLPEGVPEKVFGKDSAPISAFHGQDDPLVTVDRPRAAVARLEKDGFRVKLQEFPGVGHSIPPSLRAALFQELGAACLRESEAQ